MIGKLLNKWIDFVRDHIHVITLLISFSLVGLIVIQVYLISIEIDVEHKNFDHEIKKALKDIHHIVEDNEALSKNLYDFATHQLEPAVDRDSIGNELLIEMKEFTDSILLARNLGSLEYDFAFYQRAEDTIVLSTSKIFTQPDFQKYSVRAGWRIKEAAGGNLFKFGLLFHNKSWFLFYQVSSILIISTLFIIILLGSFFSTNLVVKRQKQMSQIKNDFINNLTHELKTPIFASSVLFKIIRGKISTSSYQDLDYHLSLLEKENLQLKHKVEKVLELTILERQKPKLDWQKIDLHKIIEQKIAIFQILINEKNGLISYSLKAENPWLVGDLMHIGNILDNILDNAIKYSESAPDIFIKTYNQNERLIIRISDHGIGIENEHLSFVFDKFYRVSHGNLHQIKGFGLGLSYVKTMTGLHSGKVEVDSTIGKGSTFTLTFPVASKQKTETYAPENTIG